MLVHGAFVPPRAPLEELAGVVRSVRRVVDAAPTTGRRWGRQREEVAAPPSDPPLDDVPLESMRLPITGFGNVTTSDAHSIAEAIGAAAADWPAPTVHFSGATALDFPGDRSVWAKLDGDVAALGAIARGVTQSVERLGFFVDRRAFRPMLSIATVTDATVAADLETVVDALDAFRGQDWVVDCVVLTTSAFVGSHAESRELERIPLG